MKQNSLKFKSFFQSYTSDNIHPGFSIDCIILSFSAKKLKVLLNKFANSNYWQLPGGFMFKTESAENAAHRILESRTGLTNVYLKQFYLFSDPNRTKMDQNAKFIELDGDRNNDQEDTEKWFLQRFISLGYYSFVRYENAKLTSTKIDTARWFNINELPKLYSDHNQIIAKSLYTIRENITSLPLAHELLPEKFTMSEFRKIYEMILNKPIDRRNFQKKALSSGIVTQLKEVRDTSTYNPPILYSFSAGRANMDEFHSLLR